MNANQPKVEANNLCDPILFQVGMWGWFRAWTKWALHGKDWLWEMSFEINSVIVRAADMQIG